MSTTIKAMKRVQEIKAKRERIFYKNRMAGKKERELEESIKALQKNIELVDAPAIKQKVLEHGLASKVVAKDVEMA